MSTSQTTTAKNVKLLVVFRDQQETVEIELDRAQAARVVKHSQTAMASRAPFYGTDANGNPFIVDVGLVAIAIKIEEIEE